MADSDAPLPPDFLFGVATAGFQIEGGFNGRDEPRNNWFGFEAEGRVEPSGTTLDFWNRYEAQLDRAVAAGCNAFRFSLEWARCEPVDGEYDDDAFARYADIVDACTERGLTPLVTLHHFTHPWWAGEDFWLGSDSPERFTAWADEAARRLGSAVRHWVTINEFNILALQTYFTGDFPPAHNADVRSVVTSLDHLLAAHVGAYGAIHAHRPDAIVSTNGYQFSMYELDRLFSDVLLARRAGVPRDELNRWLAGRRNRHTAALQPLAGPERLLRAGMAKLIKGADALPRAVAAVYASPHECTLDHLQLDAYNPVTSSHFRFPGHQSSGGRHYGIDRQLWDDLPDPERFEALLPIAAEKGLDLWIVENGMCNRVHNGRSYPRLDGWDRPRYLQTHLAAMMSAIDAGVPIGAYFHWTLADNYEWGSYEPCFGLYGVDRARGNTWSDRDAMGRNSALVFRRLIEGLQAGDRSVLTCPVSDLER